MPTTKTRRAVLAGAAALPALAASAALASISSDDPIFAAIEAHRAAMLNRFEKERILCNTEDASPEYTACEAAFHVAFEAEEESALGLAHVRLTTKAGALALLRYGDDLYAQKVVLPSHPTQWQSHHENLSKFVDDDVVAAFNSKPIELPLMFLAVSR